MREIRAGIIGLGDIARGHMNDMKRSGKMMIPYAICDVSGENLRQAGMKYEIPPERCYTDYKALLARDDIDMVSICTPNVTHYEIAMEAVRNGKAYALEKPVAMTLEEAKELKDATLAAGVANTVCFSYRYLPAIYKAKSIMESGVLGSIYHVYAQYIEGKEDNQNIPLLWRYQKELAGSGSLGDLGSHTLDMVCYLAGGFKKVTGCSGVLIPKRRKLDGSGLGDVTTEDYFHALATMQDGISATFAFTKFAWGRKNAHRVEIYGSQGGMIYTLEKGIDSLKLCLGEDQNQAGNWTEVILDRNAASQMQCFGEILQGGSNKTPATIADGYYVQAVMEAMLSADADQTWKQVAEFVD